MDNSITVCILILIGVLVGFAIPYVYLAVTYLIKRIQSPDETAAHALRRLNEVIFSCFLETNYPQSIYPYERRIHEYKKIFMQAILQCKKTDELNYIYEVMMNYAQLRWRVTDFTIFSVCHNELRRLFVSIQAILQDRKSIKNITTCEDALREFEELYQQVLQVTSPDPLAFLLFIDAVKKLLP